MEMGLPADKDSFRFGADNEEGGEGREAEEVCVSSRPSVSGVREKDVATFERLLPPPPRVKALLAAGFLLLSTPDTGKINYSAALTPLSSSFSLCHICTLLAWCGVLLVSCVDSTHQHT